jgi:hypothetical protein
LEEYEEMKKTLVIIGICAVLLSMPTLSALEFTEAPTNIPLPQKKLVTPPIDDYDGTFVGGLGRLYRAGGEWQFNLHAYLAGVYKLGAYKKLYGYIYNLDEEQIGYIGAYFGQKLILGYIEGMQNHRAPIVGFLFWDDQHFAGRIMSFIGPAPHIIGEYTPNV